MVGGKGGDSRTVKLVRPFSEEKVLAAIKGLNSEGTPSPDGIPVFFYKEFWVLVGPDLMATLHKFHQENHGMEKINKSHVFLLPKCEGVDKVDGFHPISLSNSIYLIIAKVLANRLHEVNDELVGPFQ